jgi:hypothetical protein
VTEKDSVPVRELTPLQRSAASREVHGASLAEGGYCAGQHLLGSCEDAYIRAKAARDLAEHRCA